MGTALLIASVALFGGGSVATGVRARNWRDGAQPDTDYWTKQGDAGKQASARIGPPVSGGKYRLSATSIGPGGTFPPIQVDWSIYAVPK